MKDGNNVLLRKCYVFSIRVIKLYQYLIYDRKEYVISKQLLRSGTSIGANIEEDQGAQSCRDFLSKISIAYKEARETRYWIRLLFFSKFTNNLKVESVLNECEEIIKIITACQKTIKKKLK